jgi:hypothetical protein
MDEAAANVCDDGMSVARTRIELPPSGSSWQHAKIIMPVGRVRANIPVYCDPAPAFAALENGEVAQRPSLLRASPGGVTPRPVPGQFYSSCASRSASMSLRSRIACLLVGMSIPLVVATCARPGPGCRANVRRERIGAQHYVSR